MLPADLGKPGNVQWAEPSPPVWLFPAWGAVNVQTGRRAALTWMFSGNLSGGGAGERAPQAQW